MDSFLTNKYFCLALIVALAVILYLYNTRDACVVEGMDNVDLSVLAPELTDYPWANGEEGKYRYVNTAFDKEADETVKRNLAKQGYKAEFLKSSDQVFDEYEEENRSGRLLRNGNGNGRRNGNGKNGNGRFPTPKDDHPELAQCQPCNCDDDIDTEEYYERKLQKIRKNKNNKRT